MSVEFEYWYGKIIEYESDPKKVTKLAWLHQQTRIDSILKSRTVLKEKIQDLEAKLSTQWDSGYRHGAKEASGKIKGLEVQLARAADLVSKLKVEVYSLYKQATNKRLDKSQDFTCIVKRKVTDAEQFLKTFEELEKGE